MTLNAGLLNANILTTTITESSMGVMKTKS